MVAFLFPTPFVFRRPRTTFLHSGLPLPITPSTPPLHFTLPSRQAITACTSRNTYYDPDGALKTEGTHETTDPKGNCTMCKGSNVLPCYVCNGVGYLGSSGKLVCKYCRGSKVVGCPLCTDEHDPYKLSYTDPSSISDNFNVYPYPYNPEEHGDLDPDTEIT